MICLIDIRDVLDAHSIPPETHRTVSAAAKVLGLPRSRRVRSAQKRLQDQWRGLKNVFCANLHQSCLVTKNS